MIEDTREPVEYRQSSPECFCDFCGVDVEPEWEEDEYGATGRCPECGKEITYDAKFIEE